ncbi:uncharacterized protein LOC117815491 isoform X2 [Notolabrus celidotus]|uniref:uncharacterized protein LOC117815491 isoform X2 n=1 Tax=Notolabrus celidotus TaxID=1203425 RepID=UPI00148F5FE0|nr:uncharacterized protein LOC117815491 isoform X2 [Notolabrus celidotus]
MDMPRYRWPGFKMQLLAELQRQQNETQFCDTFLQTEGISVPAHSCILAALSPYLSRKLLSSPSPPSGQKQQLQLQAVKAQTLLKLVGLLYSGELEVTGSMEQNDVLSAARQFGITELVEGQLKEMKGGDPQQRVCQSCKDKEVEGRERNERWEMQNAGVQSDIAEASAADSLTEKRTSVSTGTQTVLTCKKAVSSSFNHSNQTTASDQEPTSSLPQSTMQTQNTTPDQHFGSSSVPPISSIPGGRSSDETFALDGSSDSLTNAISTSALCSDVITFPFSLTSDSDSLTLQEYSLHQHSSEGETTGNMTDSRDNEENQSPHTLRDVMLGVGGGQRQDRANAKMRGMAQMKQMRQMVEATQISIKVKLRRRTKEEVWEVVDRQGKDETLATLSSLQQDDSNQKQQQTTPSNDGSPPSSTQPGSISTLKTQGPVEENDEQIEKLLEDIMMGLNILPDLETETKKSHHPQPSKHQAPTPYWIQHTENDGVQGQVHAGVGAAGYGCYQDFGTQLCLSSTDTDQSLPSCSSLSSVQPDAVSVQQQQQQYSPQCQLSLTSMGKSGDLSHQGMMTLSTSQIPNHEGATTSVIPPAFNSSVHRLQDPECKDQSSQEDQNILKFLPLANGNQAKPSHSFSLPCMGDLRLPRCLSPLESPGSTSKHQPFCSDSTDHNTEIQPQPSLHGPPWLTETPTSLQFPFSAITHKESTSGPTSQDTSINCWAKRQKKDLKLISQSEKTWGDLCDVNKKGTTLASPHNVTDRKSEAPKKRNRKRTRHPPEDNGSLPCKELKVSDGKESRFNLSVCSVSLSSNNVLAKERQMANGSTCKPVTSAEKPNEPSTVKEGQQEKIRGPLGRIRTRSSLKGAQETPNNPSPECTSALRSLSIPKRKRGRPPKRKYTKRSESSAAVTEQNSDTVEREPQTNKDLSKVKEDEDKTQRMFKKRKRNRGEVEVDPPKMTLNAKSAGTTETDINQNMNPAGRKPKPPRTVTLKEFQKLIKRQHIKAKMSKESQDKDTNVTSKKGEGEEKAPGSEREGLTRETEIDNILPHITEGIKESHSMNNGTVDINDNQIFNKSATELSESQRDDPRSSTAEEASWFDEEQCSVFTFGDLGEEVEKLAAKREQPLKDLCGAQACATAESDATQWINGDGSSLNDPNQCSEDTMHSDHSLNPQTPQRTVLPLMDADGCNRISGCAQVGKDEEEDEEAEVDILLCSPDKVPQTRDRENGLENVDTSPEEDEEEDVKEIDVTGDETE